MRRRKLQRNAKLERICDAGMGINLALGILYTWSIFKGAIAKSIETGGEGAFDWERASLNDPYAVCCIVFAFAMILAGKCQDKFGPRLTALVGGVLVSPWFYLDISIHALCGVGCWLWYSGRDRIRLFFCHPTGAQAVSARQDGLDCRPDGNRQRSRDGKKIYGRCGLCGGCHYGCG